MVLRFSFTGYRHFPRIREETSTNTHTTPDLPRRAGQSTKFPENKITTVPHLRAPMQRFLKEKLFNNRHLTVRKVKAASILVLLRDFGNKKILRPRSSQKARENTEALKLIFDYHSDTKSSREKLWKIPWLKCIIPTHLTAHSMETKAIAEKTANCYKKRKSKITKQSKSYENILRRKDDR